MKETAHKYCRCWRQPEEDVEKGRRFWICVKEVDKREDMYIIRGREGERHDEREKKKKKDTRNKR